MTMATGLFVIAPVERRCRRQVRYPNGVIDMRVRAQPNENAIREATLTAERTHELVLHTNMCYKYSSWNSHKAGPMSNITFAIDDDLLRKSKVAAAQMDTSLNAIVRTLLVGFVESVGGKVQQPENYRKLLDFSLGKVTYRSLMKDLNIDSDESLFLMMCGAGLPMPRLAEEETQQMVDLIGKVISA